uniref:1-acylglycerol-3-phosphate O-acyltransferase n=1 Tax=Strigamia maritima TaxID=126957 RepID=T1JIY0_STRMM
MMTVVTDVIIRFASDISFKVLGTNNLKSCKGSAILVANHQSSLDGFGCSQYWFHVDPCSVVSKKALAYFGPLGLLLYLCGFVFIDRANTAEAKDKLDHQFKQIVDRK